ncbi:MAG: cupin domain-containing protein [Hyphomicrobiales bacterium]|nr:cupin domain-containing protein [Hyphomicrobiales bacterium]
MEFYTDERCYIVEIHNRNDDEACSIARARVAPGVTTQLHALRAIDERYVIIDGKGSVEIDGGSPTPVRPLDVVAIVAGRSQRITNTGDTDLLFLCICTPRFDTSRYVNMESPTDQG